MSSSTASRRTLWAWTLGTFFGAGFLKPGPGTYGSAAATLLWYAAAHALAPTRTGLVVATTLAALVLTLTGIPASTLVARESGRKDPGFVVVDEAAGVLVALIAIAPDWKHAAVSFLLFRAFDITKPWPIRKLEALPEGTGIMLDDIAAGLLALAVAHLLARFY